MACLVNDVDDGGSLNMRDLDDSLDIFQLPPLEYIRSLKNDYLYCLCSCVNPKQKAMCILRYCIFPNEDLLTWALPWMLLQLFGAARVQVRVVVLLDYGSVDVPHCPQELPPNNDIASDHNLSSSFRESYHHSKLVFKSILMLHLFAFASATASFHACLQRPSHQHQPCHTISTAVQQDTSRKS